MGQTKNYLISQEDYFNHDCHCSPEDSCQICEDFFTQEQKKGLENHLKLVNEKPVRWQTPRFIKNFWEWILNK